MECVQCAKKVIDALRGAGHGGKRLSVVVEGGTPGKNYIWSSTAPGMHGGRAVGEGFHEAVEVEGVVFDNLHPEGIARADWQAGLSTARGGVIRIIEEVF